MKLTIFPFGFGVIALVTLAALFYAFENWRGRWEVNRVERELTESGEVLELARFVPPSVRESENFGSAPVLREWTTEPPAHSLQFRLSQAVREVFLGADPLTDEGREILRQAMKTPPAETVSDDAFLDYWGERLKPFDGIRSQLVERLGLPGTSWNHQVTSRMSGSDYPLFEKPVLEWVKLMRAYALYHVHRGMAEEVREDCEVMLRLAEMSGAEPTMISLVITLANLHLTTDVIQQALHKRIFGLSDLERLAEKFESIDLQARLLHALRSDRAYVWNVARMSAPALRRVIREELANLETWTGYYPRGWALRGLAELGEVYQDAIRCLRDEEPFGRQVKAIGRTFAEASQITSRRRWLLPTLTGRFTGVPDMCLETARHVALVEGVLAVERYRLRHGRLPKYLQELPEILAHDPEDGEPMIYRPLEDETYVLEIPDPYNERSEERSFIDLVFHSADSESEDPSR